MNNKNTLKKSILASMFLTLGVVLPFFTGQIKEIGDSLLPMHIPVLLCGFICGGGWGALVGLLLPFIRSILFSMPPMFPNAVWMSAELLTYGFVSGFLYNRFKKKNYVAIYISLITAQITGRLSWAVVKTFLWGIYGKSFTLTAFFLGGFVDSSLGIILQLAVIPLLVSIVYKSERKGE